MPRAEEVYTDAQMETLNGLNTGFSNNYGEPCECGPEPYTTKKKHGFSDSLIFYHYCGECGNEFSTWIEG